MAAIVEEIKNALQDSIKHIGSQLQQIQAYGQNNRQLMQQINRAVAGSNNPAANNMQRQLPLTLEQLNAASQKLTQAKNTLEGIKGRI